MELKNKDGLTEKEFLDTYNDSMYKKPSFTVDMLIFTVSDGPRQSYRKLPQKSLKILMVKRGNHPYMGQWALPGGFVSIDENINDAAYRELKEEVNIDNIYMEQLYTWGAVDRDPRARVISCSYMSLVDSSMLNVKAGDDADDAKWFTVSSSLIEQKKEMSPKGYKLRELVKIELSCGDICLSAIIKKKKNVEGRVRNTDSEIVDVHGIAFDHSMIIQYGIDRLRNKIEYTDIVFNLMPSEFTLTELQQAYEVILGRELLKANFRRKIMHMVKETGKFTADAGHRPSKLYTFNPDWVERVF